MADAKIQPRSGAAADREAARARLRDSIDTLSEKASLQVQLQKEPLKMLGGATGVGLALGVLVGRSFKKSRRVYVDAASSKKEQQRLHKLQTQRSERGLSSAITATIVTLGFRMLQERVLVPKLSEYADKLLSSQQGATPQEAAQRDRAPQASSQPKAPSSQTPFNQTHSTPSTQTYSSQLRPGEGAVGGGVPTPATKPDLHKM